MRYGSLEWAYAQPFARALSEDASFRSWVLQRTKFASLAGEARLLDREMLAARTPGTTSWWRSHYTEACRCPGCSGKETDLLAIFAIKNEYRFALHLEFKRPSDRFQLGQAEAYPIRADCWVQKPPRSVLPHAAATTALVCSDGDVPSFQANLRHFSVRFTFEEIASAFPDATASVTKRNDATSLSRKPMAASHLRVHEFSENIMDWNAAAEDTLTHLRQGNRVFSVGLMVGFVDKLCLEKQVSQGQFLSVCPSTDAIGTILGHVTKAVHGPGAVPIDGWYRKAGQTYAVHPAFAEAWIKLRRL